MGICPECRKFMKSNIKSMNKTKNILSFIFIFLVAIIPGFTINGHFDIGVYFISVFVILIAFGFIIFPIFKSIVKFFYNKNGKFVDVKVSEGIKSNSLRDKMILDAKSFSTAP